MESEELIKKYNIDIEKLEKEQIKLSKQLEIEDKIDFSLADRFGAVDTSFIGNKILVSIIVCGRIMENENGKKSCEVLERVYFLDKIRFPYLPEFRAYRELPAMVDAFNKLNEKPDLVFISGQGISHPRLGLASHFSLSTGVPTIGVANSVPSCELNGGDILKAGKIVGKVLVSKEKSKPMFVSPGNQISIDSSLKICKEFVNFPHKLPEPLHLAGKYSREIRDELKLG